MWLIVLLSKALWVNVFYTCLSNVVNHNVTLKTCVCSTHGSFWHLASNINMWRLNWTQLDCPVLTLITSSGKSKSDAHPFSVHSPLVGLVCALVLQGSSWSKHWMHFLNSGNLWVEDEYFTCVVGSLCQSVDDLTYMIIQCKVLVTLYQLQLCGSVFPTLWWCDFVFVMYEGFAAHTQAQICGSVL